MDTAVGRVVGGHGWLWIGIALVSLVFLPLPRATCIFSWGIAHGHGDAKLLLHDSGKLWRMGWQLHNQKRAHSHALLPFHACSAYYPLPGRIFIIKSTNCNTSQTSIDRVLLTLLPVIAVSLAKTAQATPLAPKASSP
jgi:hypothetical protein